MKGGCKGVLAALAVFAALAVTVVLKPPKFETSLETIVGGEAFALPAPVRKAASSRVQAIASAPSFDAALALADKFVATLDERLVKSVRFRLDAKALSQVLDFYGNAGGGFVSQGDRKLHAESGEALYSEVLGRIASPVPSLFGFKEDPLRFLDGFVKSLPQGFGRWKTKGDVLAAEKDGIWNVLVSFAIPDCEALNIKALPLILGGVVENVKHLNAVSKPARLVLCGVPVHTLETSGRCERQIGMLSTFSLLFVLILAIVTLKSMKAVALLALNLALASAMGFAVLNLAFDSIHLLSLVFGTVLIGITVDYSFHRLLAASPDALAKVRANLVKSCLTTLVSLVPLALSGIHILVQSAFFLSAGLVMSLVFNLFALNLFNLRLPTFSKCADDSRRQGGWREGVPVLPALLVLAILPLTVLVDFKTEAEDLHSPSQELKSAERLFAELSGIGPDTGMLVVEGGSLDEALEKEECLSLNTMSLSKLVPSFARRQENYKLVEEFYGKYARKLAMQLGCEAAFPLPPLPQRIEAQELSRDIAGQFLFPGDDGKVLTLVPQVSRHEAEVASKVPGVRFYAPRFMLLEMLASSEKRILHLLLASFAALWLVLMIYYRARAILVVVPSLLAVSLTFAAVSLFCGHVNIFHLLSAFMIVGMAIDYTIFLAGDFRCGFKAVVCSLLTSMAGFGALSFVSFPVVRSVGIAIGIGLPLSFFFAWLIFRPRHQREERAATAFGLELTWIIYRTFGKRALDFVSWVVGNLVWACDSKARRATGSRRKLVNFAMSLGDKIAVLSMGRGQPRIKLDEAGDARKFVEDVISKKGVVVISSHLGNIETLAAYGECAAKFHVFMALSLTKVFRMFKERHSCRSMIEMHPTEGFSMAELFMGSQIVESGDVVLIAGDRGGGRLREMPFLGAKRSFPEGAFRFAKHLECPVYFVACVRERGGYRVFAKCLSEQDLIGDYVRELERLVKLYPEQWYQWDGEGSANG